MTLKTLNELYLHELADIHSAEEQLVKALPKMAEAASDPRLKAAFQQHLSETQIQADRVQAIMQRMNGSAPSKTCKAMKGLIDEGQEVIKDRGEPAVKDAALIGAAQRVEHYEIAAYGCARTYAELLGDEAGARALETTLEEEKRTDAKLNELATQIINLKAAASV